MTTQALPNTPSLPRIWLGAIRPRTLTAAIAPVWVGTALATSHGSARLGPALAALLGAVFLQIGTNLFNDYADFKSGADTDARLGPARAAQKGWLTPKQLARGSVLVLAAATLVGVYLIAVAGWPIVVIGIASLLAAVAYTGGPWPFGYKGLGDLFVMVFFGLVAVCGTYFVQTQTLRFDVVLAALAVGSWATAILVVNNLRDRHTDADAGKRTLAVRIGAKWTRVEYVALLLAAYILPLVAWVKEGNAGWLLPAVTLPLAFKLSVQLYRREGADLNPLLGSTALAGLAYAATLGVGLMAFGRSGFL